MTIPKGVMTRKKIPPSTIGFTTAWIAAPTFIQARLSGFSSFALASVTASVSAAKAASTIAIGTWRAHAAHAAPSRNTTTKVKPNERSEGGGTGLGMAGLRRVLRITVERFEFAAGGSWSFAD